MGAALDMLISLRDRVDLTIKEIESAIGTVYESKVPTAKVGPMIGAHAKFMEDLTGQLENGKISIAQFDTQVQVGIQDSFTKAYAAGKGVKISDLTDGDLEFLRRAGQAEFEFAAKFGRDIESGGLIMSRVDRANMYGGAVNGMAWNGAVESMPDESRINWVLTAQESCLDCLSLAASSPFLKINLPTTPGAGSTICRSITSPWARVLTKRGAIPIVDVVVGDSVLTHVGRWKRVLATPVYPSGEHHRQAWVNAPTGKFVGFTSDHEFLSDDGWLAIGEVAKRRLSVYTVPYEMLKVWNENSKRCKKRDMHIMPSGLPDVWKEEGPPGGRVSFVRYESKGKVAVGGPVVPGQDLFWYCGRWEKTAQAIRRFVFRTLQHTKTGWSHVYVFLGWRTQADNLQIPVVVGAGARGYFRWDGLTPYQRRLFGRQVRESQVDENRGTCRHALARQSQPSMVGRQAGMGLSNMQQEVQDASKSRNEQPQILLEEMCKQGEDQRARDTDLQNVRQRVREDDCGAQTSNGKVLLCEVLQRPPLYDLTVEDDCSFIVEGLVVHNSNCQCRLTFTTGPMTKDEKAQAAKYGSARDQGVKDMLDVSPPKGMRLPNGIEQDYIDSLRNEINFERRKVAQLETGSNEWKKAVSRRSNLNGELIEFIEQEGIFEVPVYSVDEVITAADIGVKAQHDIMLTGLDGGSLDVISDKQLDVMVNRYEKTVGDELPKDSTAAKKKYRRPQVKKGKK